MNKISVISILGTVLLLHTAPVIAANTVIVIPIGAHDTLLLPENIKCGITINGVTGNYTGIDNTVCSAGQIWMDRNLGASRVATSSTDSLAQGSLYQWGRLSDGHQNRISTTISDTSVNNDPGHTNFILPPSPPWDWKFPQNDDLWQGINGINNPCPEGFRLPTETEWTTQVATWKTNNIAGGFASPLKLVTGGYRDYLTANIYNQISIGYYWSSTTSGTNAKNFRVGEGGTGVDNFERANGLSVRCIKD